MEFADFHRGLENKLNPEKGGFSRWKTKEKSSSDAIVAKRTEKAHGGGMSGEHLYFKNFVLIVMPDGLSIGHFYTLRNG